MRAEASEQYKIALKAGQKNYKDCVLRGKYPYPQVLDDILMDSMVSGQVELGISEIPSDLIIGTKVKGRKNAFSASFMPLLDASTEFANKWMDLCASHLEDGIRDPIKCYEYLGRFYVQEGNKRVSVLKSLGAPSILASVTRVIPCYTEDREIQLYYEFLQFYQLSKVYEFQFNHPGAYTRLQAALNMEPDHVWTSEERKVIVSRFSRFREIFEKFTDENPSMDVCDGFYLWLSLYTLDDIKAMTETEILKKLKLMKPDILALSQSTPVQVQTSSAESGDKGLLNRIFGIGKVSKLHVAFINDRSPEDSVWVAAHELGRKYVDSILSSRVSTVSYSLLDPSGDAEALMEEAIGDGANVLFATTPTLIGACRKIAVRHPEAYILNCSVSMPYTGVRTYYSRIYEGKFITGAIAGAMGDSDTIGYVASYPIMGVPASINAFALGAQLTNPRARIQLHWSCTPGNYQDVFTRKGIHIISNRDVPSAAHAYDDWGTYRLEADGTLTSLASPFWDWGKFYERVIRRILDGLWDSDNGSGSKKAINYWWGMESEVIDVRLAQDLPEGVAQLAKILRQGVMDGSIDIFHRRIISQDGMIRNDGSQWFSPEEILHMDWLCENVDGAIPAYSEVLPMSQSIVRLLGIYRDQIPPEKGAVIL